MLKIFSLCFILHTVLAVDHQDVLLDERIIGGETASITDHPYQASIAYMGSHRCGGVVIARTWILTSARCVHGDIDFLKLTVRVGSTFHSMGGIVENIARVVSHTNYNTEALYDFDIALIQLRRPIPLIEFVRIVALPDNGNGIVERRLANVTGWGITTSDDPLPSTLLQGIEIPIISQSVCVDLYRSLGLTITDTMFCAGLWEGGKDPCTMDNGGPLVSNSVLLGIVSWGVSCGKPHRPGVYTNVGVLRDWITDITGI